MDDILDLVATRTRVASVTAAAFDGYKASRYLLYICSTRNSPRLGLDKAFRLPFPLTPKGPVYIGGAMMSYLSKTNAGLQIEIDGEEKREIKRENESRRHGTCEKGRGRSDRPQYLNLLRIRSA